jgi:alpha-tubulin suppressor-like RCC1 family protein/plastocyanin
MPAISQVSLFEKHGCAVSSDNRAFCWGRNSSGQLGDATTTMRRVPVAVRGGLQFRQISTGVSHTCAVTTTNLAYCWGNNGRGHLGDGTTTRRLMPVRVMGGLAFREVTAGTKHTCGVTTANVVYCWGDNASGQLGAGTTGGMQLTPRRIAGTLQIRQVSAGSQHTCGVSTQDRIHCWGLNSSGQLGDGTTTNRPRAVQVAGSLTFSQVGTGRLHTCAVGLDRLAYCWGSGLQPTPMAADAALRFRQVDGGLRHTCGVTPADKARCWGNNESDQLGTGRFNTTAPEAVLTTLEFRQITGGYTSTCSVTPDSFVYCWGSNEEGELGTGDNRRHVVPAPVGGRRDGFATVLMGNFFFGSSDVFFSSEQNGSINPAVDTVRVGETVTWLQTNGIHNVHSLGTPSFASSVNLGFRGSGRTYAVQFTAPGLYEYDCSRHPDRMWGRILVVE